MKYKELERIAVKVGWTIRENRETYSLEKETEEAERRITIGKIYSKIIFINNDICRPEDFVVIKAAVELAETPTGERIPEEKFYLKHRWMKYAGNKDVEKYYNLHIETNLPYLGSKNQDGENQTQFTQKEINEIKEKYNTDLKDFEIIEVEE